MCIINPPTPEVMTRFAHEGSPLRPDHLSQHLFSHTVEMGVRFPTQELWGTHSSHSKLDLLVARPVPTCILYHEI